jgi:outer membrane protein assembly factor BamB
MEAGTSNNAVYVGGGGAEGTASLYALNANSTTAPHTSLGSSLSHFVWSSRAVYNGSVYIGNTSY